MPGEQSSHGNNNGGCTEIQVTLHKGEEEAFLWFFEVVSVNTAIQHLHG